MNWQDDKFGQGIIIYNTVYREDHTGLRTSLASLQNQPETIPAIECYNASS